MQGKKLISSISNGSIHNGHWNEKYKLTIYLHIIVYWAQQGFLTDILKIKPYDDRKKNPTSFNK